MPYKEMSLEQLFAAADAIEANADWSIDDNLTVEQLFAKTDAIEVASNRSTDEGSLENLFAQADQIMAQPHYRD